MNSYALASFIISILSFLLGFFVFLKSRKSLINRAYLDLMLSISLWSFGLYRVFLSLSEAIALFWCHFLYIGSIFIPTSFVIFVLKFLGLQQKNKNLVKLLYSSSFLFVVLNFTPLFIKGVEKKLNFIYWAKPGIIYPFYPLFFFACIVYGCYLLIKTYSSSVESNYIRNQIRYILISCFFGFGGGLTVFLVDLDIKINPFGIYSISLFPIIMAYAILKFRLMDIRVAITRTGIFIMVYTLVLGLPFLLASNIVWRNKIVVLIGSIWWTVPLGLMAVLATAGPFIYIYLNRKAEERLLKEQRRYQNILKEASLGMTRIRDLKRLLNLITHIVTKSVKISYIGIYLYHRDSDEFLLEVSRDKGRTPIPKLTSENTLITWIQLRRQPLIYEEVKRQAQDSPDPAYKQLEENMRALTASVVLPSFLEDRFLGFIVLGEKMSGQIYTMEDLNVFQVLASQAALAIENAQFYNEAKEMQLQIAQAEKMATIGTMADGLSHQINNRFYALSLIAGDSMDTLKLTDTTNCTPEVKEMLGQISHALERIQVNVMQGSEVVKGMLKYSRTGSEDFEALSVDQIIDDTLEMVQFKVKLSEIDIVRDYPKETPKIHGNLAQLEEVFFNFIDNAYDAIVERRTTLKEEGYRGRVTISAHPKDSKLEITIEDNGMGVKDDDNRKLFTPFFTTKSSSRTKGTGLGLYVINKIITEAHKGKITFESDYKVGTRFIVELPLAK